MTDEDWGASFAKSVAVFLNGHGIPDRDARGQRVLDDSFLLCFNAHYEPIEFTLPQRNSAHPGRSWCTPGPRRRRPPTRCPAEAGSMWRHTPPWCCEAFLGLAVPTVKPIRRMPRLRSPFLRIERIVRAE